MTDPTIRHRAARLTQALNPRHIPLPAPRYVRTANDDWAHCPNIDLTFTSLADLTAWAMWADVPIEDSIGTQGFVGYCFEAAINDVPIYCAYFTDVREQVTA